MSSLPLNISAALSLNPFGGLFLSRAQKESMISAYPALKRNHARLWDLHNNIVEADLSASVSAAVEPLVLKARGLLLANDDRFRTLDAQLRSAAEEAIRKGSVSQAAWTGSGLAAMPIAVMAAMVAALALGWYAIYRLTGPASAETQTLLLQAKAQIDAATRGQPIPQFPPSSAAGGRSSAPAAFAGGAATAALLALGAVLFLGGRGRR